MQRFDPAKSVGRSRSLRFAGWLALVLALGAPVRGEAQCGVVAGKFKWVWGGLTANAFVVDTNAALAWAVEDGGRIRTTANGIDWTFQTSPPCAQSQLRAIQMLRPAPLRTGWAVGDSGAVLKTADGGLNWTQLASLTDALGKPAMLWDVYFRDLNNGWVVGEHLFKQSSNGGVTWSDVVVTHPTQPSFSIAAGEFYSIDFSTVGTNYVGLVAAEPGMVLRSDQSSAGSSWTVVYDRCAPSLSPPLCSGCATSCTDPTQFEPWDVEFVPAATSLATAEAVVVGGIGVQCAEFLATPDGGLSWHQEFPLDDPCNAVVPPASCAACATGAPSCPGSGATAVQPTQYNTTTFAGRSGVSVGYGGTILVRDAACSPPIWRLKPQIQGPVQAFSQPFRGVDGNGVGGGVGVAWSTGMWGGLFKSGDGGNNWVPQTTTTTIARFADLTFANDLDGWMVGQSFKVQRTVDGGVSWAAQDVVLGAGNLSDLAFAPGLQVGVAVGGLYNGEAKIVRTTTGGAGTLATGGGWANVVPPPLAPSNRNLSAVVYTAGSEFWAIGAGGVVLDSTNGGASWSVVPLTVLGVPQTAVLNGIAFSDPNTGYAVGRDGSLGKIYRLTNATNPAARVWTDVSPAGPIDLQGVAARGALVYSVGKKLATGVEVGAIYKWNGTAFAEETGLPTIPGCTFLSDVTDGPPFFSFTGLFNEVAIAPTTAQVFVGGSCGRFLHFDGALWRELKSETSSHITSLSFFSDSRGFAHGAAPETIVKYTP